MTSPRKHVSWIACQGEKGACGHNVTRRASFVQDHFQPAPQPTYEEVFELLGDGRSDRAVVAIHNSRTGNIIEPLSHMAHYGFGVVDELFHQINHCLMVTRGLASRFGVTSEEDLDDAKRAAILSSIKEVRSDEQGLRQCKDFIARNLPRARPITMLCTATAAKSIKTDADELGKEIQNPPYGDAVGAIAGAFCAKMYDLIVLERTVQDYQHENITRYVVLEKKPRNMASIIHDYDRKLFGNAFGEGDPADGDMRPADEDQLDQLERLSKIAAEKPNDAIPQRNKILAEEGALKLATKILILDDMRTSPNLKNHREWVDLSKVANLLNGKGYKGRGRSPLTQPPGSGKVDNKSIPKTARKEIDAHANAIRKTGSVGLHSKQKDEDQHRTFVFLQAHKKGRSIHEVLRQFNQSTIELLQILPPPAPEKGEGAILEIRGMDFPAKPGDKTKAKTKLGQVLQNIHAQDARTKHKNHPCQITVLGCFRSQDRELSLKEGEQADREYDNPENEILPRYLEN